MFSQFSIQVFERMHDRTLSGAIAEENRAGISDRTLRNWFSRRTTPAPDLLAQLESGRRQWLLEDLEAKGWAEEERIIFADGLDACPGTVSALAFFLHGVDGRYPAFLQRAKEVDLLEQALVERRQADDAHGWVKVLRETPWIRDVHLNDPEDDTRKRDTWEILDPSRGWEGLERGAKLLVFNLQFEMLAMLDLEFCAHYLEGVAAVPVFAAFLPRLNSRMELAARDNFPARRNLYHHPQRRLLDTVACMRQARYNRAWPEAVPPVKDMAIWLDLAGQSELASNLGKWRSGRPMTAARFEALWDACFDFLPIAQRPAVPIPMMYASAVFAKLFVHRNRETRQLTRWVPEPKFYRGWWELQLRALTSGSAPLRFGTEAWMPGLA